MIVLSPGQCCVASGGVQSVIARCHSPPDTTISCTDSIIGWFEHSWVAGLLTHAVHTVLIFIKTIFSFVVSGRQWVNLSSGLKGGAAFLLMMFLFFGMGHAASDGVFRINYGVISNRIGSFRTVYDHWMHTCHINMPKEQFYKLHDTSRRSSPRRVAMRISIDLLIFLSEPVDRSTSNVFFWSSLCGQLQAPAFSGWTSVTVLLQVIR